MIQRIQVVAIAALVAIVPNGVEGRPSYYSTQNWVPLSSTAPVMGGDNSAESMLSFEPSIVDGYVGGQTYTVTCAFSYGYGQIMGSDKGTWVNGATKGTTTGVSFISATQDSSESVNSQWTAPSSGAGAVKLGCTRAGTSDGGGTGGTRTDERTINEKGGATPAVTTTAAVAVTTTQQAPTELEPVPWQFTYQPHTVADAQIPDGFKFNFSWNVTDTHIIVEIGAASDGWVGLGIGEPGAGAMPGGDFVTCTKHGVVKDAYATGYTQPVDDVSQDWELLAYSYSATDGDRLVCRLKRKLDTGDPQDRSLVSTHYRLGPINFMFAFGSISGSGTPTYHSINNRATAQLKLGSSVDRLTQLLALPDLGTTVDALNDYFQIPTARTTYQNKCTNIPSSLGTRSLIGIAPVIEDATRAEIHHFVVNAFAGNNCQNDMGQIYVWAPGAEIEVFPEFLGLKINGGNGAVSINVQTHYNNPTNKAGLVDNGGVRFYVTNANVLRPVEMGVLSLADLDTDLAGTDLADTDGLSSYTFQCDAAFSNSWPHDIRIFKFAHHMHVAGQRMETNVTRNGAVVAQYNTEYYDFNFQTPLYVDAIWKKGDSFTTQCFYDSRTTPRSNPTGKFGKGSDDEMCIDFIWYYPRMDKTVCKFDETGDNTDGSTLVDSESIATIERDYGDASGSSQMSDAFRDVVWSEDYFTTDTCDVRVATLAWGAVSDETCVRYPLSVPLTFKVGGTWLGDLYMKVDIDVDAGKVTTLGTNCNADCSSCESSVNVEIQETGCTSYGQGLWRITRDYLKPTRTITASPTNGPTNSPTLSPSVTTTFSPSLTKFPTESPSSLPTPRPTASPVTSAPVTSAPAAAPVLPTTVKTTTASGDDNGNGNGASGSSEKEEDATTAAIVIGVIAVVVLAAIIVATTMYLKKSTKSLKFESDTVQIVGQTVTNTDVSEF